MLEMVVLKEGLQIEQGSPLQVEFVRIGLALPDSENQARSGCSSPIKVSRSTKPGWPA